MDIVYRILLLPGFVVLYLLQGFLSLFGLSLSLERKIDWLSYIAAAALVVSIAFYLTVIWLFRHTTFVWK